MTKALLVVEMLKLLPAVPVETLAMTLLGTTFRDFKLPLASTWTKVELVKVAIWTLPWAVTWKKEEPEEEARTKIFFAAPAGFCTNKVAVGELVPMPTLALLFINKAWVEEAVTENGFKA